MENDKEKLLYQLHNAHLIDTFFLNNGSLPMDTM